jgi:hypothetical protein
MAIVPEMLVDISYDYWNPTSAQNILMQHFTWKYSKYHIYLFISIEKV